MSHYSASFSMTLRRADQRAHESLFVEDSDARREVSLGLASPAGVSP
jgi:hypothetical protein